MLLRASQMHTLLSVQFASDLLERVFTEENEQLPWLLFILPGDLLRAAALLITRESPSSVFSNKLVEVNLFMLCCLQSSYGASLPGTSRLHHSNTSSLPCKQLFKKHYYCISLKGSVLTPPPPACHHTTLSPGMSQGRSPPHQHPHCTSPQAPWHVPLGSF